MKVMFVVQRYGDKIAGGSEQCCRFYAERLAACGHTVEVTTSCATNYVDWANDFPPGHDVVNGLAVHRFPVDRPRVGPKFSLLDKIVVWQNEPAPLALQELWVDEMGPRTLELPEYLRQRCDDVDAMVFFTYLYYPTIRGLEAVAGRVPTLFHPTAHVEPHMTVPIFDRLFRLPDAYGFLTPEESELVSSRFGDPAVSDVLGVGVDLDVAGDGDVFRCTFGIGNAPYLLYLGRVDPGKGSLEMFDYFVELKRRNPGPLKLVIVGDPVMPLPPHPDVVTTGFVSEETKRDAIAGCTVFLQPSYFESFSMALTEAWALRRPALVQGRCDVLAGQARRSGGALSYTGFAEFEAMVEVLVDDAALLARLGEAGHAYVEQHYRWDDLMVRYQDLLERTVEQFGNRRSGQGR